MDSGIAGMWRGGMLKLDNSRFCAGCEFKHSDSREFLCKKGYWAASSPHTLSMERGEVIRVNECIRNEVVQNSTKRMFYTNRYQVKVAKIDGVEIPDFCFKCIGYCPGESYQPYGWSSGDSPPGCSRGRIAFPTRKGSCKRHKEAT